MAYDNGTEKVPTEAEKKLTEALVRAVNQEGGLPVLVKDVGVCHFHGGAVTNVAVKEVWAFLTYQGVPYRTDTTRDKELLLEGKLSSATLVRLTPIKQTPEVETETRTSKFIPRSQHNKRALGMAIT